MNINSYSHLLQKAIDAFAGLPGVGRKSALRLALFLLRQDRDFTHQFTSDLNNFIDEIKFCERCHNVSDDTVCAICKDERRDDSILCVVESIREVLAIERTGLYHGRYHVLGGLISPMDGVGPDDLFLQDLPTRVAEEGITEVLLALSTTMEGDTTNFYIYRLLEGLGVRVTVIARGISVGDELEYADEITLGRSIENRIDFTSTLKG